MKIILVLLLMCSASAACGEIYTWKNVRGTVFYTNSLNEIPARYLRKARVLDVATGKKAGLATAQPIVPSGSAAPGQIPVQQTPPNPVATPVPPVAAGASPAVANPAPSPAPPATGVAAPQLQPRETRSTRRTQRRLNRSGAEGE